jgi:hypothetical protein
MHRRTVNSNRRFALELDLQVNTIGLDSSWARLHYAGLVSFKALSFFSFFLAKFFLQIGYNISNAKFDFEGNTATELK